MSAFYEPDPSVKPLVLLGAELRKHRKRTGISIDRLAEVIPFSASLIGFTERGQRRAGRSFMEHYDEAVGAGGELVRLWEHVTRSASPRWFRGWLDIEQEAHSLHTWQPLLVPGLLQTEEYARAVIRSEPGITDKQTEKAVAARMERQEIFARDTPPLFRAVLDEGVLHRLVGSKEIMRRQLERLMEAVESPRVGVQIIPLKLGVMTGLLGGFVIAQIPGSPDNVYIESIIHGHVTSRPEDVEAIHSKYDTLRAEAQPRHMSIELIREVEKLWT
ncbi:helix-turn-helix transcriptional regulator [Streptosporangium sp. NPDC000563]|uniref:helix-turn-helix domain-containing protein n=1 Tax=Streptosporangium sp. NPDC000563 TaxID=3154366 RepID=UPI0033177549